jgi:RimJ/RimL family protein N-acetyltransferase
VSTTRAALTGPLRTDRLTLRPATADDADATWRFRRRTDVSHWITRASATLDEHRAWFRAPDSLARTLVIEHDGTVIGDLMLKIEDAWAQAEIAERARGMQAELGWVLDPEHAGHGYATEAVRELLRLCFEDLGLHRVTATCFAANEASWRLMERAGMRREFYTVRDSLHRSGEWLDCVGYALLADEWHGAARPGAGGTGSLPARS